MCFDYVKIFALLLNDLNDSMKLPPGKYRLEDCLETFSPMKILTMNISHKKTRKILDEKCFTTNKKNRTSLKSKGIGGTGKSIL